MSSEMLDAYYENQSNMDSLSRDHVNYLYKMKESGINPKVIYDIGANVLHWTNAAMKVWPDAEIYVFDAFTPFENLYKKRNLKYHIGCLSDVDNKTVKFYQDAIHSAGNSYYREIGSPANIFTPDKFVEKQTITLDTIIKMNSWPSPQLCKFDTQQSEIDIIRGAGKALKDCSHMLIELQNIEYNEGALLADESTVELEKLGWKCKTKKFSSNIADADYHFINTNIKE